MSSDDRLYRKTMTKADHDAALAGERITDRYARRGGPKLERPPADPHVVVLADGCATWLTYQRREDAERGLAQVLRPDGNPELFAGAEVVPFRRKDRRMLHRDTGLEMPTWATCPVHGERR